MNKDPGKLSWTEKGFFVLAVVILVFFIKVLDLACGEIDV